MRARIEEAIKEFVAIFEMGQPVGERFTIKTASVFPVYSFYQLDNVAIVINQWLVEHRTLGEIQMTYPTHKNGG